MIPSYIKGVERTIINRLVDHALSLGYLISVWDGEDYAVKLSDNTKEIKQKIGATDVTYLIMHIDQDAGTIMLVHGNDEDVISDYHDNPALKSLVDYATKGLN